MRLKPNGSSRRKVCFLGEVADLINKKLNITHQHLAAGVVTYGDGINDLNTILTLNEVISNLGGSLVEVQHSGGIHHQDSIAVRFHPQMQAKLVG